VKNTGAVYEARTYGSVRGMRRKPHPTRLISRLNPFSCLNHLFVLQFYDINTALNSGERMKSVLLLLAVSVSLLSGCTTKKVPSNSTPYRVNNVVITEPLAIDSNTEVALAKYSHVINSVKLDKERLAQFLYDRGVIYDSLGMRFLAQMDFHRALEFKPAYADAYNFIGIHLTLTGQYEKAFEAFDNALDIEPNHSYVRLNRGIASYYYGNNELAMEDLEQFYVKNPTDPYRAIWLYLSEYALDPEGARLRLLYNANQLNKEQWAYQLVELFLGDLDEQKFIDNMAKQLKNRRELADRLCEGYFYLAKLKLLQGEEEIAKNYFRLALTTNVYEFVEHKYARLELQRLEELAKSRFAPFKPLPKATN